jgi:hypothetical protein
MGVRELRETQKRKKKEKRKVETWKGSNGRLSEEEKVRD